MDFFDCGPNRNQLSNDAGETGSRNEINVLVAEDNVIIQKTLQEILEFKSYRFTIVSNGKKALDEFSRASGAKRYDIILMDLQMPEMDGFQATECIRSIERGTGEHIPIIALTGHSIENSKGQCLSLGMDDYLLKPFNVEDLIEIIERLSANR